MSIYTSSLGLYIELKGNNLCEIAELCLPILAQVGLPSITGWEIPLFSKKRVRGLAKVLKKYQDNSQYNRQYIGDTLDSKFYLGEDIVFYISEIPKQNMVWECNLNMYVENHHTSKDIEDFITAAVELTSRLLRQTEVYWAKLSRNCNDLGCVPSVPIANNNTHLVLTTMAEVEECYENPEVFWNGGWSSFEEFGGKYLLTRWLKATEKIAFLAEVLPHHWAMAHGAKPGLTKYWLPEVEPEEKKIFYKDKPYLQVVGIHPTQKYLEYACDLPDGEYIAPYEIYKLREIRSKGKWKRRKIEAIHVVFFNQEMAEQEKRPLLDIGVRVFYMNKLAKDVEITDNTEETTSANTNNSLSSYLAKYINHQENYLQILSSYEIEISAATEGLPRSYKRSIIELRQRLRESAAQKLAQLNSTEIDNFFSALTPDVDLRTQGEIRTILHQLQNHSPDVVENKFYLSVGLKPIFNQYFEPDDEEIGYLDRLLGCLVDYAYELGEHGFLVGIECRDILWEEEEESSYRDQPTQRPLVIAAYWLVEYEVDEETNQKIIAALQNFQRETYYPYRYLFNLPHPIADILLPGFCQASQAPETSHYLLEHIIKLNVLRIPGVQKLSLGGLEPHISAVTEWRNALINDPDFVPIQATREEMLKFYDETLLPMLHLCQEHNLIFVFGF